MAALDQKQERMWAMFCHLGSFSGFIIPFGHIIVPLVIWLIQKKESPLIDREGKKALNFQISLTIYAIISALLILVLIGIFLLWAIVIFDIVAVIIAAVKTSSGEEFNYPLAIEFVK
jgi:uncharacterized Tic20 family protein